VTDGPAARAAERRAAVDATARRLSIALAGAIRSRPGRVTDAADLSAAYRSGEAPADPRGHVHDDASAAAYAAARMPATYAACARAMAAAADRVPAFRPATLLDVGAGTGAATWAATAVWPSLVEATLIDRERAALGLGRRLVSRAAPAAPRVGEPAGHAAPHHALATATWRATAVDADDLPGADLVVAGYLLGEIAPDRLPAVIAGLWAATNSMLVLVEPGSRAGFARIRDARGELIAAGARVAAPCPGDGPCPIADPAWCHFLARLDRSLLQRTAKAAARSWEDEPFSYVAVTRDPPAPAARVVLGRPRRRPGVVELRVCAPGGIETRTLSRRDGAAWRVARDLEWGDPVSPAVLAAGRGESGRPDGIRPEAGEQAPDRPDLGRSDPGR
jgi:ribosomal protein RSM22 (predicted rRNA methylase)